ncbi:MAG TPA: Fe-S cluster assembly protein SufD [Gemmatimonadales bacterium]|nr:Fe-S cluster assembly protein SufD [Gemmatimonadales bacterium]
MNGTWQDDFKAMVAGRVPGWLPALRQAGMSRFEQEGFPVSRDEEWRFTPIAPISRGVFQPATSPGVVFPRDEAEALAYGPESWPQLVFVNGRFAPEISNTPALPAGVVVLSLAEALARRPELVEPHLGKHVTVEATPFTALNAAFIQDGAFVLVPEGIELATPIQLCFVMTGDQHERVTHPRNLIVIGERARATVIESYHGTGGREDGTRGGPFTAGRPDLPPSRPPAYLTNAVTEVVLGAHAWLEHSRIQRESESAYHIAFSHVHQAEESHYRSFSLAMGAAISRHNLHTRLGAPETEALLYGLSIAEGTQLSDHHTAIYHDEPNCRSWEVYKAILDGESRGVFNGKVFVTPEAQKTDAKQTNRTLLLSERARVDTKPQLEIFADDVKCTHGATVGYLDDLPLFYFRSRGMPEDRARKLLTYAFAAEVLDEIQVPEVRKALDAVVRGRLGVAS